MNAKGAGHLDASKLGYVKQAGEGKITFVVGGDAATFEATRPGVTFATCFQDSRCSLRHVLD